MKKLGLALGSGGLRGAAHIGVLDVLEKAGIVPHAISGSSAGAAVAAVYASGYSPEEMVNIALSLKPDDVIDSTISVTDLLVMIARVILKRLGIRKPPLPPPPLGFIKGDRILSLLLEWTRGAHFSDLRLPLAIVAVDIDRALKVLFGPADAVRPAAQKLSRFVMGPDVTVAEAVRASIAIPGVFVPLSRHGRTLIDGAVMDSVPAQVLKEMGCDVVVGVRLGFVDRSKQYISDVVELVERSVSIMGDEATEHELLSYADLVIDPQIYDVGLRDVHRIAEIIHKGRLAAQRALPIIYELLREEK
ncbi:MAG: patatin-like phospholipase family protein [Bacillota bacterium]